MTSDLVSIADLSDADVEDLLDAAEGFARDVKSGFDRRRGAILATLFLEPSTRTRLSFEAAMLRLGGRVVTSADPKSASSAKGETLADTTRMVDAYADVIVLRHPLSGAARLSADVARRPLVNGGDGGREHPTQTLVDLFTLRRRFGKLEGLTVAVYGDLRYGRTTHSLAEALSRRGARVLFLAEPGLEFPEHALERLVERGARASTVDVVGAGGAFGSAPLKVRAVGDFGPKFDLDRERLDAIYATRVQAERLPKGVGGVRSLPRIDPGFLARPAFSETAILHPLPRTSEIDPSCDSDPRAEYFRQAEAGVPVRMAILDAVLDGRRFRGEEGPVVEADRPCGEAVCITSAEPVRARTIGSRCAYCGEKTP
jgi:aspartate carbamoyltransferase catalytic subunit